MSDGLKRTGMIRTGEHAGGLDSDALASVLDFASGDWNDIGGGFFDQTKTHSKGTDKFTHDVQDIDTANNEYVGVHKVEFPTLDTVKMTVNTAGSTRNLRLLLHYISE